MFLTKPTMDLSTNSSHIFHFISGSFRSLSLFLLAFDPAQKTINHVQTVSTLGPHQYIATNQHKDRIFTTTWAQPPSLQSWALERFDSHPWRISHLNTAPISTSSLWILLRNEKTNYSPISAATSSYIDVPPPFTHIYSVGGPTGEVHLIDEHTGGFGKKAQEILFVPEDELPKADKTRVGLVSNSAVFKLYPSQHEFLTLAVANWFSWCRVRINTFILLDIRSCARH